MSHSYKFRILTLTLTSAAHNYSRPSKRLGFNGNFPSLKFIQFTPALISSCMEGSEPSRIFFRVDGIKRLFSAQKLYHRL